MEILGRVHGQAVSLAVPLTVREISLGGMSIEAPVAFPVDAIHEFRLTLGDGSTVLLRGRVVYCRPAKGGEAPVFVCGLHFVDDEPVTGQAVSDVIDRIS
jgi:hypothetical protein